MWTTGESLTLLFLSFLLMGLVLLAYFKDRLETWWRRRHR